MWHSRTLRTVFVLAALAPFLRADVLTVGPAGSGAQFRQIQMAVAAAQPDDVILVQPGTYQRIVVDRPLRIAGTAPGVLIQGGNDQTAVLVRDIAAGQEFVLAGVDATTVSFLTRPNTIQLQNSPGTLVLSGVSILNDPFGPSYGGLVSTACARVLLPNCRILQAGELEDQTGAVVAEASELWVSGAEIRGADDPYFALSGCHGIQATDSILRVWRSLIVGGGAEGKNGIGNGMGGAAIHATRSRVELFGGPGMELRGGNGEELIFGEGLGAPGLDLLDHSSARIQDDIPLTGGIDGFDVTQAPPVRADGTSTFTPDPKVFPTLATSTRRVALGSSFGVTLAGNPGGYQVLFLSLRTGPTATYRWVDGVGLLDQTNLYQLAAEVLSGNTLTIPVQVPASTVLLGATLFLQAAERFPNGSGRLSSVPRRFALSNPALVTITN